MDQDHVDDAAAIAATQTQPPLSGKTVLLVHPAWHSCGSHQVFVSQARAYRSLGAKVLSLAVADSPGAIEGTRPHKAYMAATTDLDADARYYGGMSLFGVLNPNFLRAAKNWLHGNFAAILVESTKLVAIPEQLVTAPRIDLIHCNHFFCMPAAMRLQEMRAEAMRAEAMGAEAMRDCPILLDTHDLQARQYALRNAAGWTIPPAARFDDMLAIELAAMRRADVLLHLNDAEAASFRNLLPDQRHELLYPAVSPVPAGLGGADLMIVASANNANFLGLSWFLQEVLPLAPGVAVKIIGNIDRELQRRAPGLFKQHAGLFLGRIEDLNAAYANAAAILLPTTEGHGISIKTIEAMSSGAPLIATAHAFRGLGLDPARLANVTLAQDAASFATALRRADGSRGSEKGDRRRADTRRAYEKLFAPAAYHAALRALVEPLLARGA